MSDYISEKIEQYERKLKQAEKAGKHNNGFRQRARAGHVVRAGRDKLVAREDVSRRPPPAFLGHCSREDQGRDVLLEEALSGVVAVRLDSRDKI